MITVIKQFTFDAAHRLPNHKGKCKQMHGHTYKLEIGVTGNIQPATGMVVDFGDLKKIIQKQVIDLLDHQLLNEVGEGGDCPTVLEKERLMDHQLLNEVWEGGDCPTVLEKERLNNNPFPNYLPTAENMVEWIRYQLIAMINTTDKQLTFIRLWETPTSYAEWRKDAWKRIM